MSLTPEQKKEFQKLAQPLIEWINENGHPHVTVIVDTTHAEVLEGVCAFHTMEYVPD